MKNQNLIYLGIVAVAGFLLFKKYNKITIAEAKAVLNDWKKNFDSKNLDGIVNNYSQDGILVSTFGDILTGREAIKEYFIGLFKKDKLSVDYLFYNLKLNRQNGTGSGQPQITIPEISEKIICMVVRFCLF